MLIDGEYWFIKYPKTTRGMSEKAQQISYTTAPLSEYIGSHKYFAVGSVRFVLAWTEIHQDELMQDWELAKDNLPLLKIAPLK